MISIRDVIDTIEGPVGAARERTLAVREVLERAGLDIPVRLWDGTELGDGPFRLVLEHPWSLRSLLVPPTDLNAGEAYAHGDVDIEGDIVAAIHVIASATETALPLLARARLVTELLRLPAPPPRNGERRAELAGERHTMQRDRDAVQFHYDLGNDFFRRFLDEDLVYSCAYFDDGWGDDPARHLEAAQQRKLDMICRKLDLRDDESFLDVGCGWGSLVLHAAQRYGVRAVGVTLSGAQAALARERVADAGLEDRVTILERDYREVTGQFDAVASVGMVEHVGSDQLPTYFARLRELVTDGGRLLNHGITTGQRQQARDMTDDEDSFVAHYVFPDGGLVPAWRTVREVERAGFEVHDVHQLRRHYALTLRAWIQRLETNREQAVAAASETDYRIWRAYMAGSVVGFETNDLGVVQVLAGAGWDAPLDRSHMHPTNRPATAP